MASFRDAVKYVLSGIVITYLIAISLTILLGIVATGFKSAFGEFDNPFTDVYNAVRNLTLFILIFLPAFGLIMFGFIADLVLTFFVPIINDLFSMELSTEIGGKSVMDIVGTYDPATGTSAGIIGQIMTLINGIFPPLE